MADHRDPESVSAGPDVVDAAAAAIAEARRSLRVAARGERGKWAADGAGRMTAGTRSEQLAPIRQQVTDLVYSAILADVGGESETTVAQRAIAKSLAEAIVLREMVWSHMCETGGPVSSKGRRRPVFDMHAQLSDRIGRLAGGFIERKARRVDESVGDILG